MNKESVLYYDTIIRYHQVLLLNIMKHTNIGACETWIIYYMDWKRDILRVEISDAILVKVTMNNLSSINALECQSYISRVLAGILALQKPMEIPKTRLYMMLFWS